MPQQREYQRQGSLWLLDTERAILADEPGLGKTNQALMAAVGRTLILSPAMLSDVWSEEIAAWRPDLDITWSSYQSVCRRVPTVNANGKTVHQVVVAPREHLAQDWDTIICDEAHHLKGRDTSWTKVVHKMAGKAGRIYLLTGTPLPNWGHEVFMSLRLLYPGDRRFTNYWKWVGDWFRTSKPPFGGTKIGTLATVPPRASAERIAQGYAEAAEAWGIDTRWKRRLMEDVLDELPPMTVQNIMCPMRPAQRRAYDSLKKDFVATLPETGAEVASWDGGGIHGKLLQCSTGLPTLKDGEVASGKFDILADLVRHRTRPTVIFCAYRRTADAVHELMSKLGLRSGVVHGGYSMAERQRTIQGFKAGEFPFLVGTIGVLSEGITLTIADTAIFVERSTRPDRNEQARRRIRRFGQTRPTLVIDLVTKDSVDETLTKLLKKKALDSSGAITGFDLAAAAGLI